MTEEFNKTNNEETQPPIDQDAPSTTDATTPETTDATTPETTDATTSNEVSNADSTEVSNADSTEPPRDPNTIYVGKKRVMNYVMACMTVLQSGSDKVSIKARGRSISAAVDVAQILTRRFTQGVTVKSIIISTEKVPNRETNELSNVSSIEIEMGK